MQSLSLIHAMVLLDKKECLRGNEKNWRFVRNEKTMALANELAFQVLGRNLGEIPRKTQILFLLIEKMGERKYQEKKNGLSSFRFTPTEIQIKTGWSSREIREHLKILKNIGFIGIRNKKYKILFSSG